MCTQHIRQTLTSMKGEINSNTIIMGDFNTSLTPMDRSTKWKIRKETHNLNRPITRSEIESVVLKTF